jgi:hypothetical protein
MAAISIRRALGAGFSLVRRRPVSVFVWGLLLVLFVQAPLFAVMLNGAVDVLASFGTARKLTPAAIVAAQSTLQQRMAIVQAFMLPLYYVRAVVTAAAFRAVLEPRNSAFAYLRLGRQEAWLFLLTLCLAVGLPYLAMPLILLVAGAIAAAAWLPSPWNLGLWAVGGITTILIVWAITRLGLAAPLTFAERRFRLFESWAVTRGQALRLFILWLVILLIVVVIEALIYGAIAAAVVLSGAIHSVDLASVRSWLLQLQTGQGLAEAAPWLGAVAVAEAVVFGAVSAIAAAPFASAFRDLRPSPVSAAC